MNVLDLFSGIGGFSLGLERAGMRTVAFCEIEPYCQKVLAKHWPDVPCYGDIRDLTADRLAADGIHVDVICGGFPCQDISNAGEKVGIDGERSGLWREYARLIGELRPKFVVVENVSALLGRGLGRVLGELAEIGYDAEWHCIPASAIGAAHQRDRIWIVSYPHDQGQPVGAVHDEAPWVPQAFAHAYSFRGRQEQIGELRGGYQAISGNDGETQSLAHARRQPAQIQASGQQPAVSLAEWDSWWATEPDVGRVADGVPSRMDRLRALGNAVVPQIPELIGHAIMRAA